MIILSSQEPEANASLLIDNKLVTDESKYITVKTKDLPKGSHTKIKIK